MVDIISQLLAKYPLIVSILAGVGAFRAIFKPLMTAVDSYVLSTPSTKDDAAVAKVESNKIFKGFVWVVDYLFSIKLPSK